jgi:hypothetical protein
MASVVTRKQTMWLAPCLKSKAAGSPKMKHGWSFMKMWRPISALAGASLQACLGELLEDRAAKLIGWRPATVNLPPYNCGMTAVAR